MAKTLKSVFSRVYALRKKLEMTEGGIIIPEETIERRSSVKADVARIVLMGSECDSNFKVGDDVLVGQYAYKIIDTDLLKLNGYDLSVPEGHELLVFNEVDVLGVFVDG